jgi:Sporulation and spore germination
MKKILAGLIVILVVGVLLGYGISWMSQQVQKTEDEPIRVVIEALPERMVQLYFTAPEGTFLMAETVAIPGCEEDRDCIMSLVQALTHGSQVGNLAVLPQQTAVLSAEIENDLVRIDLSQKVVDFHPGGSLTELLSIYSIANSLSENFPYIRQVQLLVDGEIRQTLKGHARIDQPIYADLSYNRSPMEQGEDSSKISGQQGLSIEQLIEQVVPDERN